MGNTYSLSGGIKIPANANLNDYVTPGNYYCNSDNDAPTMLNAPFDSSFTLKVEYAIGTGYPCQTARRYGDGNQAYRIKIGSGWGEWKETNKTIVYEDVNVGDVTISNNGYMKILNKNCLFATIQDWASNTGAFGIAQAGNSGIYAVGTPGVVIKTLLIRVWNWRG